MRRFLEAKRYRFGILVLTLFLSFAGGARAEEEFFRFTTSDGSALHVEHGTLEVGRVEPGWWSAMWERGSAGKGVFFFRNRFTGQYLVANGQSLATTSEAPSTTGQGPHYWRYDQSFQASGTPNSALVTQTGFYLNGSAAGPVLELRASGYTTLHVEEVVPEAPPEVAEEVVYYRLLKGKDPLNNEQGPPVFSPADAGFFSAMWEARETNAAGDGRFMVFTNRWTGQVLSSSGSTLTTQAPGDIKTGKEPFLWRAVKTGKTLEFLDLTNSQGAKLQQILLQQVE